MVRHSCRHKPPAILFALLLLGNAQAVDLESKLTQSKQNRRFDTSTLPENLLVPDAPTDLTFEVSCQNQGLITWKHESNADGFLFGLCHEGDAMCFVETIDASARQCEFQLPKSNASYKIYLSAFTNFFVTPLYSDPAATQFSSYPKVPDFKSLKWTPLNYSAIQATWEENWAHEIKFIVCRIPKECEKRVVLGALKQLTFAGLAANTAYTIFAQAEVKLNNKTCEGTVESRTAWTFPLAPGPVSNLKYRILKSVYLNAGWDAPNDTTPVDGYTVECRDIEGFYDVAEDVFEKTFVDVTIDLSKFASTFNCSVWAFVNSSHHGRVNGTKTLFEVATHHIDPPVDLNVIVQCKNEADIEWHYELGVPITGFVAEVCWMNGSLCEDRILSAPARELSHLLEQFSALYNVSVVAYVNDSLQTVYSRSTKAEFFSFPKVPGLDDVIVSALSSTALRAVWKEEWDHEIEFLVCTTPYNCQSHTVAGALQQYTFNGLRPDTKYNVYAQAEVALYNNTCKGPLQNRSASTFPEAPGPVSNLKYNIVNSVFLNANWDGPNDKPVDGYTIQCTDFEGPYQVVKDVFHTNVSLPLHKFASRFNCSVWAFINVSLYQRVNGTKRVFEVATQNIEPPMGVNVTVQCRNNATITWEYDLGIEITGFLANLCWLNGSLCKKRRLSPTTREISYQLQDDDALYNISLLAYLNDSLQTIVSQPTTAKFVSFPKLPEVKSLFLTTLNCSAIQATWKEEWSHEIKFRACNQLTKCEENVVFGMLQKHIFNGLVPDSTYTISAQTMVTLNNRTCQGIPQYCTTQTFPKPPGPVSKLGFEIVNGVFLNADWDAPNYTTPVDGYSIECKDVEGAYDVSRDVLAAKTPVNMTVPLRKFASTFNCSVWAFINSSIGERVNGTRTMFEVTTRSLEPPVDLKVNVQCQNKARVTWNYKPLVNITGFVAAFCWMNRSACTNKTLPAVAREVSHRLQEDNALYNISVEAYINDSVQTTYSRPATGKFVSFPKMAGMDEVSVTALSSTALRAVWKEEWDHEIQFNVCTTPYDCKSYVVLGALLECTFSGLQPDTVYNVSAQAEVTLNNRTCKGTQQSHSVCTLAEAPGPVSKLNYEIVNGVFLYADWDAPNDTTSVDGYTIECSDVKGAFGVSLDVLAAKTSVNVTIPLQKFESTFNCSVWAFTYSTHHGRVNGTKTVFEVTTHNLEPPVDLKVNVQCQNKAKITWDYEPGVNITGFVAKLCWTKGSVCTNKTLPAVAREVSYRLKEYNALYNISVEAYIDDSVQKTHSRPTARKFPSFPKITGFDDLSVTALSSTALRAVWKEQWEHEIEFNVCTTPYDCKSYVIIGTLHEHTFSGLQPDTVYNVSAQAEVTLNNKTCKGTKQSHSVCTLAEAPAIVTELKHSLKDGIILVASWKSPKTVKTVKGYTITCTDTKSGKNVTTDVDTLQPSIKVSLNLHEPVGVFHCSVWAYNKNKEGKRALGPVSPFDVTTNGIVPPRDVKLVERTATSLTYTWIADPTAPRWNITLVAEEQSVYSGMAEYGESNNTSEAHSITNLTPWTTYNVSIVNCRPAFCSEPTYVRSTTGVAAPSQVQDLKYSIVEDVQVRLTWKKPQHPNGPIEGYSVVVFNEDQQNATTYNVDGLLNETTIDLEYQFNIFNISVEAYNVDKDRNETIAGSSSEVKFETLGDGPMPPRPKVGAVTEGAVHLCWEMPEDPRYNITSFNISVSHRPPFVTRKHNFTITSLEPWTEYNVSVSSCTNATECGQGYGRHFKTDVGEPSEPLDLKAGSASRNWILVEWKPPKVCNGPLSGYNVTFEKGGEEIQETTPQLSYNLTGLSAGTPYKVSVYAFNDGLTTTKRGPGNTILVRTEFEKSSATITLLSIFIPLTLLVALVAGVFLYKRYRKTTGDREPLTTDEGH